MQVIIIYNKQSFVKNVCDNTKKDFQSNTLDILWAQKKKLAIIGLILLDMTIYEDKDIGMEVSMNMDRKKY